MIRAGWREYLKQRFTKPSKYYSVGIALNNHSVHLSVFKKQGDDLIWVMQQEFPFQDWPKAVKRYVQKNDLENTPCNVTYGVDRYQLLQVDKPGVDESEINQALSWSIQDLVPIQEEIIVDYFDLPAQPAGTEKIHAVAFARSEIEQLCTDIRESGLQLTAIGLAEFALHELLEPSDDAVMTLLQPAGQEICLSIFKGGQLYFSRRLRGYENLSTFTEQELQMGVGDNLSVEIQRSLDYFESQLRQAPVKKIYLAIETPALAYLSELLKGLTFMPVEAMMPAIKCDASFDVFNSSFSSLGAGLSCQVVPERGNT